MPTDKTPKYKCGPGYGSRGERAYQLRTEGHTWHEIAVLMEANLAADGASSVTNAAKKYAKANEKPWPIELPEEPVEPEPDEPTLRDKTREMQAAAYSERVAGRCWAWVAEMIGYTRVSHAVAGAKRYALREGKPWPIQCEA